MIENRYVADSFLASSPPNWSKFGCLTPNPGDEASKLHRFVGGQSEDGSPDGRRCSRDVRMLCGRNLFPFQAWENVADSPRSLALVRSAFGLSLRVNPR